MIRRNLDLGFLRRPQQEISEREPRNSQPETTNTAKTTNNTEVLAKINTLINDFMNGNISAREAGRTLLELGVSSTTTVNNGVTTLEFEYNGKPYRVITNSNSVDETLQNSLTTNQTLRNDGLLTILPIESTVIGPIQVCGGFPLLLNEPVVTPDKDSNRLINSEIVPVDNTDKLPDLKNPNNDFSQILTSAEVESLGFTAEEKALYLKFEKGGDAVYNLDGTFSRYTEDHYVFERVTVDGKTFIEAQELAKYLRSKDKVEIIDEIVIPPKNDVDINSIKDLETFNKLLEENSFDKEISKEEAEQYLNKVTELYTKELGQTGNYSKDYLNKVLEISKENIEIKESHFDLNKYLGEFKENIENLLAPTDLHLKNKISVFNIDYFDNVTADNLPYIINKCEKSDDIQVKFFGKMFGDLIKDKNLSSEDAQAYFNRLFITCGNDSEYSREAFKAFDFNGDGNWLSELYDLVQKEAPNIQIISQEEIDNAKVVDVEVMFGEDSELDAKELLAKLDEMAVSDDPGCIKLVQLFNNALENNCCYTEEDKENFLKAFVLLYNKNYDSSNSDKNVLRKDEFNYGNYNGLKLEWVAKTLEGNAVKNMSKIMAANEEVEDFRQGSIGDCWLLAGLKALASNPVGAEILKEQIKWADDYSEVTIYFAGVNKYVTITMDEIIKAQDSKNNGGERFSSGDIDVMVMELAMVKIMGGKIKDIEGDNSSTFWKKFLKNADIESDSARGLDDLFNAIGNLFGGGGRADLNSGSVKKILKELYKQKQNGQDFSATFAFGTFGDSSYYCTTVEGEEVLLYSTKTGWIDFSGHVFAITEITSNTVTFVNPHDTKNKKYTVTWEEFANMHVAQIQSVRLNTPEKAEKNEFSFNGEVYNIDEILSKTNPVKPTFVELTAKTKNYAKAAEDAINRIEILIDAIKENLTGYDSSKIDKACETVLNYYKAALRAGTVRSKNGTVGNNFSYYDAVNNRTITCSDRSDMRSAWDHKDVNTGEEIYKKSSGGNTGVYIGHDKESGGGDGNDKFHIFVDVQELLNRLMALLQQDFSTSL